jgi:RNA polymerase sigma factor (TIGR02999 family)
VDAVGNGSKERPYIVIIFLRSMEVTELLRAWQRGERAALDRLTTLVHAELHRMARRYMRNTRPGNTLQTTALVNEAYLRLVDVRNIDWQHRAQFFGLAAQLMRRILVDAARARGAEKRGGRAIQVNLDDAPVLSVQPDEFILRLDAALEALAGLAPREAKVVELRYFAGMTEEEAAEVLATSPRTVRRDWQFAKAWLHKEICGSSRGVRVSRRCS